jgi:histone H3/H4
MSSQSPNSSEERPPHGLQSILDEADRSLQKIDPLPFSEPAFARAKEKVEEFTRQLAVESIKTAKRHRADTVSSADVEHASQYLVSSTSHKIYKHVGTLGGIMLGAGFSNVLAMMTTGQFTTTGVASSCLLAAVGAFMVSFHIAKE